MYPHLSQLALLGSCLFGLILASPTTQAKAAGEPQPIEVFRDASALDLLDGKQKIAMSIAKTMAKYPEHFNKAQQRREVSIQSLIGSLSEIQGFEVGKTADGTLSGLETRLKAAKTATNADDNKDGNQSTGPGTGNGSGGGKGSDQGAGGTTQPVHHAASHTLNLQSEAFGKGYAAPLTVGGRRIMGDLDTGSTILVLKKSSFQPTAAVKNLKAQVDLGYGGGFVSNSLTGSAFSDDVTMGAVLGHNVGLAVVPEGTATDRIIFSDALVGLSPIRTPQIDGVSNLLPALIQEGQSKTFIMDFHRDGGTLSFAAPDRAVSWVDTVAVNKWNVHGFVRAGRPGTTYAASKHFGKGRAKKEPGSDNKAVHMRSRKTRHVRVAEATSVNTTANSARPSFPMTALIDSGTSTVLFSPTVIHALAKSLHLKVYGGDNGGYIVLVGDCASSPSLHLHLGDNFIGTVSGPNFWIGRDGDVPGQCMSAVAGVEGVADDFAILGDPFFRQQYLAFDFENKRVGFASK